MKKKKNRKTDRGTLGFAIRKRMALLLCILIVVCTGCGAAGSDAFDMMESTNSNSGTPASYATGGGIYEDSMAVAEVGADFDSAGVLEGRKLIQNVRLEVETKEYEQMMSALEMQIQELGGYIENMDAYNGSNYSDYRSSRYAELSIRIPSGKLNGFLQTVSDISNIVRRYDSVEDVTLSYVDMESRRDTLRTEQSRLLEFLERAETVEEIISLEARLSEVRYQLESMESQLRTIDNLVDYSTVNIRISEVRELTPVVEEDPTVWERITEGFMGSLDDIGGGVTELCIWFLVHIPYMVIWAVVIVTVVLLWKKHRKTRLRRQEQKRQEAQARMQSQQMAMNQWESGQWTAAPGQQTVAPGQQPAVSGQPQNDQRQN